jgi:hypothetical protein
MRASGAIGQSHIYADWKGIPYARQYVIPANPKTTPQTKTRNAFRWLQDFYRHLGPGGLEPWDLFAAGRPFIPRNGLTKANLSNLRLAVNLAGLIASSGARGGPAMDDFVAGTGAPGGNITWTITPGVLPAGWTVARGIALTTVNADPQVAFDGSYEEQVVANPGPYTGILTGLTPATTHAVCGFLIYERPDATLAASPSGNVVVTSSA